MRAILFLGLWLWSTFLLAQSEIQQQIEQTMARLQQLEAQTPLQKPDAPYDGLCVFNTKPGVYSTIFDREDRFHWQLLPKYYYDYDVDSVGTQTGINVEYSPTTDVFRIFPAIYGLWLSTPHTSLEAFRDVTEAAAKLAAGWSYTEMAKTPENFYQGIPGIHYCYKFYSGGKYYVWFAHLLWRAGVGYHVFFLTSENDYRGTLNQIYFKTVLMLVSFEAASAVLSGESTSPAPTFTIEPNFPNPFNSGTNLRYQLETAGEVKIMIFNNLGQHVRTLLTAPQPAGVHQIHWNGTDDNGETVSSGLYFYQIQTPLHQQTRAMTLMK